MSESEDFDPAVFAALSADPDIEPGEAMAAAMPDRQPARRTASKPLPLWARVAVIVCGLAGGIGWALLFR